MTGSNGIWGAIVSTIHFPDGLYLVYLQMICQDLSPLGTHIRRKDIEQMDKLIEPFAHAAYSGHVEQVKHLKRWQDLNDDEKEIYVSIAENVLEVARKQFFDDLRRKLNIVSAIENEYEKATLKREIILLLVVRLERYLRDRVKSLVPEKLDNLKLSEQKLERFHNLLMSEKFQYRGNGVDSKKGHRRIKSAVQKLVCHRNDAAHGRDVSLPIKEIGEIIEAIADLIEVRLSATITLDLKILQKH